jgi:tRNA (mo5U34)-methyltransferase
MPTDDQVRERIAQVPFWWHSIEVAPGIVTPGHKTPEIHAGEVAMLRFDDVTGKSVLDIGGWDGFYALHAESLGASRVAVLDHFVWSIDFAALDAWRTAHPEGRGPDVVEESEFWHPDTLPGKAGFDTVRELRGSRVEEIVGDFMTIPLDEVGTWDVVLFLGVLYHLQNPLGGLRRLAAMTTERAVIETHAVSLGGHPDASVWGFYPTDELGGDPTNWFVPTARALEGAVLAAGFDRVEHLTQAPPAADGAIVEYRAGLHAFKA